MRTTRHCNSLLYFLHKSITSLKKWYQLAEECRSASANTKLMVTTHSPFFVDSLKPEELWVLYRDEKGFTQAKRTAELQGVKQFMEHGALLGSLWMEDFFDVGDPLKNAAGAPQ
jgi:hypothetical protein